MNSKINVTRRQFTQAAWVTPVITAITLPIHAQTSSTTTAQPLCTSSVNINETFSSTGSVFGIGPGCVVGSGMIDFVITSYIMISNNEVELVFSHAIGVDPTNVSIGNPVMGFISVEDDIGRTWLGRLTFTFNGSQVTISGTMNLV